MHPKSAPILSAAQASSDADSPGFVSREESLYVLQVYNNYCSQEIQLKQEKAEIYNNASKAYADKSHKIVFDAPSGSDKLKMAAYYKLRQRSESYPGGTAENAQRLKEIQAELDKIEAEKPKGIPVPSRRSYSM